MTGADLCEFLIRIYAGLEDREETLAAMRRFIVDQHRIGIQEDWKAPRFDFVRDDPAYEDLMDYLQAELAVQRERVRAMERSGEMPPAPGVVLTDR
jgi:hypothetical protein